MLPAMNSIKQASHLSAAMQFLPDKYIAALSNSQSFIQTQYFLITPLLFLFFFLILTLELYILNDCTVKHMEFTFLFTLCILQRMLYQRGVWVYKEQALRRSQCHFHPLVTYFSALCALLPNVPDAPIEKQYHKQFTQPVNRSQGSLH